MWLFFHQVWLSPPDSSLLWSVSSKHSGDVCFVLIGSPLAQILHIECLNQRSGQVMMTLLISTCVCFLQHSSVDGFVEPPAPPTKSASRHSLPRCRNSFTLSTTEEQPHIGNYRLLKTIGKGNFAKVKLARHVLTGREVRQKCYLYFIDNLGITVVFTSFSVATC